MVCLWVLRTIRYGYRLQFVSVPPRFAGVIYSQVQGESAHVLQEILFLLNKVTVCVVSPLTVSERVLFKGVCIEAAIAPLRRQGIRLAIYLDYWLLLAQLEQGAAAQMHQVFFCCVGGKDELGKKRGPCNWSVAWRFPSPP